MLSSCSPRYYEQIQRGKLKKFYIVRYDSPLSVLGQSKTKSFSLKTYGTKELAFAAATEFCRRTHPYLT